MAKIAFVVQRYGREVMGGSELHCRLLAEQLAGHGHSCTVYTITAQDYVSWSNEYRDRAVGAQRRAYQSLRRERGPATYRPSMPCPTGSSATTTPGQDELAWMERQGPFCPDLIQAVGREEFGHDLVIFFTYLYYNTYWGLSGLGGAVPVPTAHDEPGPGAWHHP